MATSQIEREEKALDRELEDGTLSPAEHRKAMRELQRDYAAEAQESAQRAYDNEIDRW